MELLAPAGNSECFHAAIEAGADAVYVGGPAFNARLRADNLSMRALARLVPYAHGKGVKVYITLNIVLKQRELEQVSDLLYQLEQIGIDALIVADLGVIRLVREYFPSLPLHASTQMFFHNRAGLAVAKRMGLSRAILARELTLDELRSLAAATARPPLEVFVHGALCYSFSGLCLASSFLGGASGNRGRCTQVCRRIFTHANGRDSIFSLMDLCALQLVPTLREIGIASLKIEGRMKSATYVHTVVSAYRAVLNDPKNLPKIEQEIQYDMGRDKTRYFLSPTPSAAGHVSQRPYGGTGIYLGTIEQSTAGSFVTVTTTEVAEGDKVRIQPPSGYEGRRLRVAAVERHGKRLQLSVTDEERFSKGAGVYLVEARGRRPALKGPRLRLASGVRLRERCPFQQRIRAFIGRPTRRPSRRSELFIRIDCLGWLRHLDLKGVGGLVLGLEAHELDRLPSWRDTKLRDRSRVIVALPPFIAPGEEDAWRQRIMKLSRTGYRRWMIANAGHRALFDRQELWADSAVWSLNTLAQQSLLESGFTAFSYSIEDELLNLRVCASSHGVACLFGRAPLFVSRAEPSAAVGQRIRDNRGEHFTIMRRHGLFYLLSDQPLSLLHRRSKLAQAGIGRFILDLSFYPPHRDMARRLLTAYHSQQRFDGGKQFNFKAGLK